MVAKISLFLLHVVHVLRFRIRWRFSHVRVRSVDSTGVGRLAVFEGAVTHVGVSVLQSIV